MGCLLDLMCGKWRDSQSFCSRECYQRGKKRTAHASKRFLEGRIFGEAGGIAFDGGVWVVSNRVFGMAGDNGAEGHDAEDGTKAHDQGGHPQPSFDLGALVRAAGFEHLEFVIVYNFAAVAGTAAGCFFAVWLIEVGRGGGREQGHIDEAVGLFQAAPRLAVVPEKLVVERAHGHQQGSGCAGRLCSRVARTRRPVVGWSVGTSSH